VGEVHTQCTGPRWTCSSWREQEYHLQPADYPIPLSGLGRRTLLVGAGLDRVNGPVVGLLGAGDAMPSPAVTHTPGYRGVPARRVTLHTLQALHTSGATCASYTSGATLPSLQPAHTGHLRPMIGKH
jgi:hypothetical protein